MWGRIAQFFGFIIKAAGIIHGNISADCILDNIFYFFGLSVFFA
ncbi:hypothetical protein DSUL_20525 [Desulfovibrionales bacterium]